MRVRIPVHFLLLVCAACGKPDVAPEVVSPVAPSPFRVKTAPDVAETGQPRVLEAPETPIRGRVRFEDVHQAAGLEHVYRNGEAGRCMLMETTGGGAGWLDYDADGHWDLYLNQGGEPTKGGEPDQPTDALYRSLGDGTFTEVTASAGIFEPGYSQAVSVGDFNNDGFDDVYVTNMGRNTLFRNQGDGTFEDVTDEAGVGDQRWSASAAWADLDLDSDLDLYVCNYCVYDPHNPRLCYNEQGEPRICHPREVPGWPDECYINLGDGTFSAETRERGFAMRTPGRGLGVAVADLDNNGWPDVFVTNDVGENFYFINQGGGIFEEQAVISGCATDADGRAMANMGIAVADVDHNGYLDVYITHFHLETDTLYKNYGPGGFQDISALVGLAPLTWDRLSFGVVLADFDQDGRPEAFTACGHIENGPGYPFYRMAPQLLAFDGRRWRNASDEAGEFFQGKRVARAVAAADYDEDGDLDLAVAHENGPAALLRNDSERGHWLKLQFRGRESNRRGIGCRATLVMDDLSLMQEVCGGGSYAATHQPALVFGLGGWQGLCELTVRWPRGKGQVLHQVSVDQALVLDELHAKRVTHGNASSTP